MTDADTLVLMHRRKIPSGQFRTSRFAGLRFAQDVPVCPGARVPGAGCRVPRFRVPRFGGLAVWLPGLGRPGLPVCGSVCRFA